MLPYLSALENAIVFKSALQMSRFTLLYFHRCHYGCHSDEDDDGDDKIAVRASSEAT